MQLNVIDVFNENEKIKKTDNKLLNVNYFQLRLWTL